ncbi:MAG: metallophosphoesterase, partial [Deltaproteobacteria bacterium]|nr:metallophosphoesterase [Deltaproteobacteria bacterium]
MTLSIRRERRQPFLVSELQLNIPDLPEAFEGYRIVQLSDLHFGRTGRRLVEQAGAITNDLRPDLIALTGDYLEYTRQTVRKSILPLRVTREDSRQHVFAVRALAAELGEILAELRSVDGVVAV